MDSPHSCVRADWTRTCGIVNVDKIPTSACGFRNIREKFSAKPIVALELGCQFGALFDCPFCIEFGGDGGTSDDVGLNAVASQVVFEIAHRLLSRADHHVVDRKDLPVAALGPETDVQAVVVDQLIVDPGKLVYPFGFQ